MLTLGLCGGSGSGKSLLCEILSEHGIPTFDCDAVYHGLISKDSAVTRELVACFGDAIRAQGGGIDRRALSEIVFSDSSGGSLQKLNEITHRHVMLECKKWLSEMQRAGKQAAAVDAPLLFEARFEVICDLTVAVTAPRELRLQRITSRDGISRADAERRIDAQLSDAELEERVDLVIRNVGTEEKLREQAEQLLNLIKERAS